MNMADRQTNSMTNRMSTSLRVSAKRWCGTLFHSISPRGRLPLIAAISKIEPNRRARAEVGRGGIPVDERRGQTSDIRGFLAPQDLGWVKQERKDAVDGIADPCPRHHANAPAGSIRISSDDQAKNERKHVRQRRSNREEGLSPYDRYRWNKLLSQSFRRFGPHGIECSNPGMVRKLFVKDEAKTQHNEGKAPQKEQMSFLQAASATREPGPRPTTRTKARSLSALGSQITAAVRPSAT